MPAGTATLGEGGWTAHAGGLVLLAGIGLSLLAGWYVAVQVRGDARAAFEQEAHEIDRAIAGRLDSYKELLWDLRGLFHAPQPVTRRQFRDFVDSLALEQRNPAITTVNYGELVAHADLERFEQRVRNDRSLDPAGYPAFKVFPRRLPRPTHEVLVYLEPFASMGASFGMDMTQRPSARFEELRRSGAFLSSGELVDHQPGLPLALRLGVYRRTGSLATPEQREAAYIGSVGMGFSLLKLIEEAVPHDLLAIMRIRIRNQGRTGGPLKPPGTGSLLIDTAAAFAADARHAAGDQLLHERTTLDFGGAQLELEFESPLRLNQPLSARVLAPVVLITGVLLSVLFALFVTQQMNTRRRLQRAVAGRSAQLAAANAALEREIGERDHLERAVMHSLVEERRRYSQELHDNLGQHLVAAAFPLEVLRANLAQQRHPAAAVVAAIATDLSEAVSLARQLSHRLNPLEAGEGALEHALRELAAEQPHGSADGGALRCTVERRADAPAVRPTPDSALEHHLFRMARHWVQAAGERGVRHLHMQIRRLPLELVIEDDGTGDPGRGAMALRIIDFRCRVLDLALESGPRADGQPGMRLRIAARARAAA